MSHPVRRRSRRWARALVLGAAVTLAAASTGWSRTAAAEHEHGYGSGYEPAAELWYGGPHPLPAGSSEDYCYLTDTHAHPFEPHDPALYNWVDDVLYFIGDPLAFGASPSLLEVFVYVDAHPIDHLYGAGNCYFSGPHHHHWVPNHPELGWWRDDGSWRWRGAWDPMYWRYRGYYTTYYRSYYRPRYVVEWPTWSPPRRSYGYSARRAGGAAIPGYRTGAAVVRPAPGYGGSAYVAAPPPRPRPIVTKRAPAPAVVAPHPGRSGPAIHPAVPARPAIHPAPARPGAVKAMPPRPAPRYAPAKGKAAGPRKPYGTPAT